VSLEDTVRNLNALGIQYKVLETGTDGAALLLPEYGRVLGLWPYWRGDNALWINPDFFRSLQIGAKQTEWVNPGGDRMWLCPESEFFIPDAEHPSETFTVPHSLDPGAYTAVDEKGFSSMENQGDLWAYRAGARISFRILRRIRVYGEKELAALWGTTYLRQAGYDEETVLEVKDSPVAVGLWNATCLKVGGQARLPLQRYWADTGLTGLPAGMVELADGCAVIPCRGDKLIRAWLDAVETKSRGAYFLENRETGRATFVLKEFEKAPPGQYTREPVQRGVLGGVLGFACAGFHAPSCELGFRSPAAGGPTGKKKLSWKSSLWAFSGRTDEVLSFLRRLTA
jgi:hypothetical protein